MESVLVMPRLRPSLRTHYMRTAFQQTGNATARPLCAPPRSSRGCWPWPPPCASCEGRPGRGTGRGVSEKRRWESVPPGQGILEFLEFWRIFGNFGEFLEIFGILEFLEFLEFWGILGNFRIFGILGNVGDFLGILGIFGIFGIFGILGNFGEFLEFLEFLGNIANGISEQKDCKDGLTPL